MRLHKKSLIGVILIITNAHSVLTLFKNYFKDKLTNPPWNLKLSSNE